MYAIILKVTIKKKIHNKPTDVENTELVKKLFNPKVKKQKSKRHVEQMRQIENS